MKNLIVKFGTESLQDADMRLCQTTFDEAARQIAEIKKMGIGVTIVSSGAIQAGKENMFRLGLSLDGLDKKDLAGLGIKIYTMWQQAFDHYGIAIAQVLLTHDEIHNPAKRRSTESSLNHYLHPSIVAIVNQNDVVSAQEIESMEHGISENDHLTRLIAGMLRPKMIMFVTSVGGVFESDPRLNGGARMYRELDCGNLPAHLLRERGKSASGNGGMGKKTIEAAKCFDGERQIVIANIDDNRIIRFAQGQEVGTLLWQNNRFY